MRVRCKKLGPEGSPARRPYDTIRMKPAIVPKKIMVLSGAGIVRQGLAEASD